MSSGQQHHPVPSGREACATAIPARRWSTGTCAAAPPRLSIANHTHSPLSCAGHARSAAAPWPRRPSLPRSRRPAGRSPSSLGRCRGWACLERPTSSRSVSQRRASAGPQAEHGPAIMLRPGITRTACGRRATMQPHIKAHAACCAAMRRRRRPAPFLDETLNRSATSYSPQTRAWMTPLSAPASACSR